MILIILLAAQRRRSVDLRTKTRNDDVSRQSASRFTRPMLCLGTVSLCLFAVEKCPPIRPSVHPFTSQLQMRADPKYCLSLSVRYAAIADGHRSCSLDPSVSIRNGVALS